MRILVLNGSPRKNGTVANLLRSIVAGISDKHEVEWIDVYELNLQTLYCMYEMPAGPGMYFTAR